MKLKKETIKELGVILKEDFDLELNGISLEKFAYSLVGYFNLLVKEDQKTRFGNHQVSLIDKAKDKEEN